MNKNISVKDMKSIAFRKGMRLTYDEPRKTYLMKDAFSGELLMEYAPITMSLIDEKAWREECNKLKRQD